MSQRELLLSAADEARAWLDSLPREHRRTAPGGLCWFAYVWAATERLPVKPIPVPQTVEAEVREA